MGGQMLLISLAACVLRFGANAGQDGSSRLVCAERPWGTWERQKEARAHRTHHGVQGRSETRDTGRAAPSCSDDRAQRCLRRLSQAIGGQRRGGGRRREPARQREAKRGRGCSSISQGRLFRKVVVVVVLPTGRAASQLHGRCTGRVADVEYARSWGAQERV